MPTILITGCNRGLGLEFARQYAAEGWDVIACCRHPKKADKLQALVAQSPNVRILELDVSDISSFSAFSASLKDVAIDLLINNAGILSGGATSTTALKGDVGQILPTIDSTAWTQVLAVNTLAPIMLTQSLLPQLKRGRECKVIMISSGWGSIENMEPNFIAYRTSKAALNAATRNIAMALKAEKIICVSISPGWVSTDMGGVGADLTPEESVSGLRKTISALTPQNSGQFLRRDGGRSAW
jgi:NAD(P)-dependent dehydrogenase (short-subunit alcohol dehydrogenase family)